MPANPYPHLPPGREPGIQSRRNRSHFNFWSPFVAVVGACMFAAGVFVAAGGRGAAFDRVEEFWGGSFFALMGLMCVYGGWVMRERGRPKRPGRLRGSGLAVDRDEVRRGDELLVTFSGRGSEQSLEVGLVCVEKDDRQVRVYSQSAGAGAPVRQTTEATVHEQWQPAQPGTGEQTFTFQVPRDAPYSYEGDCISYAWRVSARAVRRLRRDPRLDRPIWVQP